MTSSSLVLGDERGGDGIRREGERWRWDTERGRGGDEIRREGEVEMGVGGEIERREREEAMPLKGDILSAGSGKERKGKERD